MTIHMLTFYLNYCHCWKLNLPLSLRAFFLSFFNIHRLHQCITKLSKILMLRNCWCRYSIPFFPCFRFINEYLRCIIFPAYFVQVIYARRTTPESDFLKHRYRRFLLMISIVILWLCLHGSYFIDIIILVCVLGVVHTRFVFIHVIIIILPVCNW